MQSVLGGTVEKATEAISHAMSSNKKVTDMKRDMVEPNSKQSLTSDTGVKMGNMEEWLSATTDDRQGPALLEDNFGREKVPNTQLPCLMLKTD
jgi:catalase